MILNIDVFDLIVFTIYIASFLTVSIVALLQKRRIKKLVAGSIQHIIDKEAILDKLDKLTMESSKQVNDGFIKFLSESREAAFEYITDVQTAIQNYVVAIHNNNADEILAARMELFSHLPEEAEGNKV